MPVGRASKRARLVPLRLWGYLGYPRTPAEIMSLKIAE